MATCWAVHLYPYVYTATGPQLNTTHKQQLAPGAGVIINSPQIVGPQVVYSDGIGKAPDVTIVGPQAQYTCDCKKQCASQFSKYKSVTQFDQRGSYTKLLCQS